MTVKSINFKSTNPVVLNKAAELFKSNRLLLTQFVLILQKCIEKHAVLETSRIKKKELLLIQGALRQKV